MKHHGLRIIAGAWRGRRIEAPPDNSIRPTLDRVRQAMFNILQWNLDGARVADLYAGTGALGFEAVSRGASHAVMVEREPVALQIIHRNLASLVDRPPSKRFTVIAGDVATMRPSHFSKQFGPFDIVFADPPYAQRGQPASPPELSAILAEPGLLKAGGVVVLQAAIGCPPPEDVPALTLVDERRYGETVVYFLRTPEAA